MYFSSTGTSFNLPNTVTIIQKMPSSTARAASVKYKQSSTEDTGNRQRGAPFRHNLYRLQSIKYGYNNHPRDAFFYGSCSCLSDKIHASIHGMRFSGTACAVHSLPSTVTILRVICLFVISLRTVYIYPKNGPKSAKECVSPALSMQLSIRFTIIQGMRFSHTGYAVVDTVYNHPRDAFLPHWVCSCWSPGC